MADDLRGCYTLHEMFTIVGSRMTQKDINILKYLYNGIMPQRIIGRVKDGVEFLLGLEKMNRVDETNFKYVVDLLRMISRHDLLQYVTLRKRKPVCPDPVNEYLEESSRLSNIPTNVPRERKRKGAEPSDQKDCKVRRRSLHRKAKSRSGFASEQSSSPGTYSSFGPGSFVTDDSDADLTTTTTKVTCDIRLRVRAEYSDHVTALTGNVNSNKPTQLERQFEKFMQATNILKSRDLGSIVCDIKFTELTYLDAFWRDYLNGSLLEALKGVFITDSLKEAVGNESIKLLVSVDEDDYEAGRLLLLENLKRSNQ
ncbi:death effector domain-containing protein-like [Saccostrea echinata]|uniref:death effector domain-containing protein-like n=1 Tax=Saccostrea echinata TaxID=191078 RepID=UPI002A83A2EB|nr:death effector domain-containing protein-like [Saccostrea echinata]